MLAGRVTESSTFALGVETTAWRRAKRERARERRAKLGYMIEAQRLVSLVLLPLIGEGQGNLCDYGASSSVLYEWENHVSKTRLFQNFVAIG